MSLNGWIKCSSGAIARPEGQELSSGLTLIKIKTRLY